ncbi:simple sugar transport system ATP-binding protein [Motilibacter peucedani]|uniref:Simple sugar transport system ATP-binding protein n=1 Tax=Motilibacter peucedani TaxID=598650 RepID=A0A420XQL5_9ACTN|nr:ATP-binding cassette domain-containing protein [Motilibacter peucedani]RKS75537.1 simple sugar transport system ATP-binding protein [Motilibacter peucedani]
MTETQTATRPVVELRGVTKRYAGVTAVSDLSLRLMPGEVFCLLGENGAGKSTVIKLLTGVERPTSGSVVVDGEEVSFSSPRAARDVGIATVYQEVATLPLMSVARNFVLGAEPTVGWGPFKRIDMATASRTALAELKNLGIRRVDDGRQLVGTMSGGERQALAIARAVHFGARVLVLDEPTAALGVRESATVLRLVSRVRERGVAVLFITHNAYHAHAAGDRFMVLRRGEPSAEFARGERSIGEVIELMAGGAELQSLLTGVERGQVGVGDDSSAV